MEPTRSPHSNRRVAAIALLLVPWLLAAAPLRASGPWSRAEVTAIEDLTHDVKRIRLRLPPAYSFQAGQFVLFRMPAKFVRDWNRKYGTRHGEVRRAYSIASGPHRLPIAEFIVKLVPAPPGKDVPPGICSTWIHRHLKTGDRIDVGPPMGKLSVSADSPKPIVLVAGGTGVAPFIGLLEHWFHARLHDRREIYLFLGVRQRRDLILHRQLLDWERAHRGFHYIPALTNPAPEDQWTGETGYVNTVLDRRFAGPLDAEALLAGSPVMMQETVKVLKAKGLPPGQIRHDPINVE